MSVPYLGFRAMKGVTELGVRFQREGGKSTPVERYGLVATP